MDVAEAAETVTVAAASRSSIGHWPNQYSSIIVAASVTDVTVAAVAPAG